MRSYTFVAIILTLVIPDSLGRSFAETKLRADRLCRDQLGISERSLEPMDPNVPAVKKYLACFYTRLGALDINGKFNREAIRILERREPTREEIACLVEKEDISETAADYYKCRVALE